MTSLFSLMLFRLPAACRLSSALPEPMMKARESALLHKSYGRRLDWRCFMSSSITNKQRCTKKGGGGLFVFIHVLPSLKSFFPLSGSFSFLGHERPEEMTSHQTGKHFLMQHTSGFHLSVFTRNVEHRIMTPF